MIAIYIYTNTLGKGHLSKLHQTPICNIESLTCDSVKGVFMLSMSVARSCSQYSMTRNMFSSSLPTTTSLSSTMLTWWSCIRILISLTLQIGNPDTSLRECTVYAQSCISIMILLAHIMCVQTHTFFFSLHPNLF